MLSLADISQSALNVCNRLKKYRTLLLGVILLGMANSAYAETFTVTTTADCIASSTSTTGGCSPGSVPAPGSLRAAIIAANATPTDDEIVFDITGSGPHSINLNRPLPDITNSVLIDGYSQAGATKRLSSNTAGISNEIPANLQIIINASASSLNNTTLLIVSGSNTTIQGLAFRNLFGSASRYIELAGSGNHRILGNYFNTDATGLLSVTTPITSASFNGIVVRSNNNIIGGLNPQDRNVFARMQRGIQFLRAAGDEPNFTQVLGNLFGVSANTSDIDSVGNRFRNRLEDLFAFGGNNSLIEGNYFGSYFGYQLRFRANNCSPTTPNAVSSGHIIKNNIFMNSAEGVGILDNICNNSTIATLDPIIISDNIFSNSQIGILLIGSTGIGYAKNILVKNNQIMGSNIPPSAAPSPGNIGGIAIRYAEDITVINNNISGQSVYGIYLYGVGTTGAAKNVVIQQNKIHDNIGHGILIGNRAGVNPKNILIKNNEITYNRSGIVAGPDPDLNDGIDSQNTNIEITENTIHSNVGLGIDLSTLLEPITFRDRLDLFSIVTILIPTSDGPSLNDIVDVDSGANHFQNFPVLDAKRSIINPALVIATGLLHSEPNQNYRIDFYSDDEVVCRAVPNNATSSVTNPGCSESESFLSAQTKYFIGRTFVTTDSQGNAPFHIVMKDAISIGKFLVATVTLLNDTGLYGETSEISQAVDVDRGGAYKHAQSTASTNKNMLTDGLTPETTVSPSIDAEYVDEQ